MARPSNDNWFDVKAILLREADRYRAKAVKAEAKEAAELRKLAGLFEDLARQLEGSLASRTRP